jgi:hypothetical protein
LTTYWSKSILSSWWLGGPAWRHGNLNFLSQEALHLPFQPVLLVPTTQVPEAGISILKRAQHAPVATLHTIPAQWLFDHKIWPLKVCNPLPPGCRNDAAAGGVFQCKLVFKSFVSVNSRLKGLSGPVLRILKKRQKRIWHNVLSIGFRKSPSP